MEGGAGKAAAHGHDTPDPLELPATRLHQGDKILANKFEFRGLSSVLSIRNPCCVPQTVNKQCTLLLACPDCRQQAAKMSDACVVCSQYWSMTDCIEMRTAEGSLHPTLSFEQSKFITKEMSRTPFVQMEQINLLIFDECHHAKKKHPYNRIMLEFYFPLSVRFCKSRNSLCCSMPSQVRFVVRMNMN